MKENYFFVTQSMDEYREKPNIRKSAKKHNQEV